MKLKLRFAYASALCFGLALVSGGACSSGTGADGQAAPTGTFAYAHYVVGLTGQPNTVFNQLNGTLTLNADGTYDKRLGVITGPDTTKTADHGTYKVSGNTITFDFPDRHDGLPHTYGGTFRYLPATKALSLRLNDNGQGMYEQVGLVQQGTESQPRTFQDDGGITMAQ